MAAFSRSIGIAYEDSLVAHIREFFAERFRAAGETEIREMIRHGIRKSGIYGIVTELDVCKYVDLVIVFGRDFDHEHVWARDILIDEELDPADRMDDVYEAAKSFEES